MFYIYSSYFLNSKQALYVYLNHALLVFFINVIIKDNIFIIFMLHWIITGTKEKPENIIDKLYKLISAYILKALLKCKK